MTDIGFGMYITNSKTRFGKYFDAIGLDFHLDTNSTKTMCL